jgi:hypothetical protein
MPERTVTVAVDTETLVLRVVPVHSTEVQPEPRVIQLGGPPVTMAELAERIGMDRSGCRKYVLRLGYKPVKMRTASSGYQMALTVTAAEARAIQQQRAADGYCEAPR